MIAARPDIRGSALSLAVSGCVGAVVLALAVSIFAVAGTPIAQSMMLIVTGAFGSAAAFHAMLAQSGIVILTGLAAVLAFRIGLNNFGAEGQLQAGALTAVAIGLLAAGWPAWLVVPLQLAAGALAGAAIMAGATLLKLRRGAEEAIVTLLTNFIVLLLAQFVLQAPLDSPTGGYAGLILGSRIPLGLIIGVSAAVVIFATTYLTVWGFELRAMAGNAEAARVAGIPIARVTMRVGLFSGALAGLGGVCLVVDTGSAQHAGLGYAGIAVAALAWLSPLGTVVAGLFVGALTVGAEAATLSGAPPAFPGMLVALTLLISLFGRHIRNRATVIVEAAR